MKLKNDVPKSAYANKDTWALWKLCQELSLEEIRVLFLKRKRELKYEQDMMKIRGIKREMEILTDAYEIIKRKKMIVYDDNEGIREDNRNKEE